MGAPPAVVPLCRTGVAENFTCAAAAVAMRLRNATARMLGCLMPGLSEGKGNLVCAAGLRLSTSAPRNLRNRPHGVLLSPSQVTVRRNPNAPVFRPAVAVRPAARAQVPQPG